MTLHLDLDSDISGDALARLVAERVTVDDYADSGRMYVEQEAVVTFPRGVGIPVFGRATCTRFFDGRCAFEAPLSVRFSASREEGEFVICTYAIEGGDHVR